VTGTAVGAGAEVGAPQTQCGATPLPPDRGQGAVYHRQRVCGKEGVSAPQTQCGATPRSHPTAGRVLVYHRQTRLPQGALRGEGLLGGGGDWPPDTVLDRPP